MQTKDFLNRARNLQFKIDKQKEQIDRWNELSLSVNSPQFDKPIVDHSPSYEAPFVKWIGKIIDMEAVIEKELVELNKVKQEIKKAVSTYIDDADTAIVIIKRYVDLLSFQEIATTLSMRNSTMYRLHKTGIEMLEKGEPYDT